MVGPASPSRRSARCERVLPQLVQSAGHVSPHRHMSRSRGFSGSSPLAQLRTAGPSLGAFNLVNPGQVLPGQSPNTSPGRRGPGCCSKPDRRAPAPACGTTPLLSDHPHFHELSRAGCRFEASSVPYYPKNASWAVSRGSARKRRAARPPESRSSGADILQYPGNRPFLLVSRDPNTPASGPKPVPAAPDVVVLQLAEVSAQHKM